MSLDEDQFTLPKSLEKLEIVPLMPYIKLYDNNCTIKSNPFYNKKLLLYNNLNNNNNNNNNKLDDNDVNKINLFGPECECDVLIKDKKINNNNLSNNNNNNKNTIMHQIQFKYKNKYTRNILKEPILKYIGRCIHHNHIKHKNLAKINNNNIYNINDNKLEKINGDVKALLLDCQSLSLRNSINNNKLHGDLTKLNNIYDLKNKLSSSRSSNGLITTWTTTTASLTASSSALATLTTMSSISSATSSSAAAGPAGAPSTTTTNSSCSQQANKMNASCDVTMDELASYFETFVYIPKKMSIMAEMMYT